MYSFFFALGQLAGESSNIEQRLRESASIALKIVGDMAKKAMLRLYGNVEGYVVDAEYKVV